MSRKFSYLSINPIGVPAGPGRGSQSLLFIDFGFPGPGPWRDVAPTNESPMLRSRDPAQPIRGQYSGHVIRRTGPEKASSELATIAHTQSHSLSRGNILTRDNSDSSSSVPQPHIYFTRNISWGILQNIPISQLNFSSYCPLLPWQPGVSLGSELSSS